MFALLNAEKADKIVVPLAALCQAARLVNEVAHSGKLDYEQLDPLLESVLMLNAPDVESIYGGVSRLRPGLLTLCDQLNLQAAKRDLQLGRYIANLVQLERYLSRNDAMQETLRLRLQQAGRLRTHQPDDDDALLTSLAGIYSDTISTLPQRIQVTGEARHLQARDNQYRIRALLLCGLRSAVLWRQLGGRRRHFLLSRRAIFDAAKRLLRRLDGQV
ncbi:high frequency lysogenization protein HflD [Permianibacter sp. IMCC34836]|uniref:high frequency lysogenization protein HflD n=1 Tax=Permianibacter fluminis TaxID=2738515 RepID=UPI0015569107|nr:high frequency lysogenization protein HflD [Permianibacter fluminis]NQD37747.1 high frequency lysogenization protein HflD [Permianibacter fluminis]